MWVTIWHGENEACLFICFYLLLSNIHPPVVARLVTMAHFVTKWVEHAVMPAQFVTIKMVTNHAACVPL